MTLASFSSLPLPPLQLSTLLDSLSESVASVDVNYIVSPRLLVFESNTPYWSLVILFWMQLKGHVGEVSKPMLCHHFVCYSALWQPFFHDQRLMLNFIDQRYGAYLYITELDQGLSNLASNQVGKKLGMGFRGQAPSFTNNWLVCLCLTFFVRFLVATIIG